MTQSSIQLTRLATACLLLGQCMAALAAPAAGPLNDTGSNVCVRKDVGFWADCRRTGQDGDHGRDVDHKSNLDGRRGFSFQRICNSGEAAGTGNCPANPVLGRAPNEWGCTLDLVTELIWELKRPGGWRDQHLRYTHQVSNTDTDTLGYVRAINETGLCGGTDWRLPSVTELQGIVHYGLQRQPLDHEWFPHTANGPVWTSEVQVADSSKAWSVDFSMFDPGQVGDFNRHQGLPVRLVRPRWQPKPAAAADERFVANPSGDEIIDTQTRLVWRRCVEGMVWTGSTCAGTPSQDTWRHAVSLARRTAKSTGEAWRLPNVKELQSLVERGRQLPAIDDVAFPATPSASGWTSTPYRRDAGKAWAVDFDHGVVDIEDSGVAATIRLVRDKRW